MAPPGIADGFRSRLFFFPGLDPGSRGQFPLPPLYWEQIRKPAASDVGDKKPLGGRAERKPMFAFALERGLLPLNEAKPLAELL